MKIHQVCISLYTFLYIYYPSVKSLIKNDCFFKVNVYEMLSFDRYKISIRKTLKGVLR